VHLGLELIGGVFGWLWIITSVATIVVLVLAIVSDFSWWWVVILLVVSLFLKQVTRNYRDEWLDTGAEINELDNKK